MSSRADIREQPLISRWSSSSVLQQAARFAGVGVVSTGIHLGIFAVLTSITGSAQSANLSALLIATVVNTALNRLWTFGIRGSARLGWHHLQALSIFLLTWAGSSGGLALMHTAVTDPGTTLQVFSIGVGNALATVVRFLAMRQWIFAAGARPTA